MVADEAITQLIHRPPVPFDDQIEGAGPPGEARVNQRGFAEVGERRRHVLFDATRLARGPEMVHASDGAISVWQGQRVSIPGRQPQS